jgi:hypothetical protein
MEVIQNPDVLHHTDKNNRNKTNRNNKNMSNNNNNNNNNNKNNKKKQGIRRRKRNKNKKRNNNNNNNNSNNNTVITRNEVVEEKESHVPTGVGPSVLSWQPVLTPEAKQQQRRQQHRSRNEIRHEQMELKQRMNTFDKMGIFDMLRSLNEITPTPEDLQDHEVVAFLRNLVPVGHEIKGEFVIPDPEFCAVAGHTASNVLTVYNEGDTRYKYNVVFGFMVFVDMKLRFVRANAHLWLKDKVTNKILDPSPLTDSKEPSGRQYLIESPSLFTVTERLMVLREPRAYCLGAILSRAVIPEFLQKQMCLSTLNERVAIRVEDLRIVPCERIDTSDNHMQEKTVLIDMKKNTFKCID